VTGPAVPGKDRDLNPTANLEKLLRTLNTRRQSSGAIPYRVPSLWTEPDSAPTTVDVRPFEYFAEVVERILAGDRRGPARIRGREGGDWSRDAVVYSMMVRATTAFDHDGNGKIDLPVNRDGWRENGTFLKATAILPYIRSLGVNTIHLLPVQEIGVDGRRGNMGSVYSVRHLAGLDEALSEPNLGLTSREQFRAFIEASHLSGLRVVLELPLRTASKDCVWIKDHPDWFYWIRGDSVFRPPGFPEEDLRTAREKTARGEYSGLPAPPRSYTDIFTLPPPPDSIRLEGDRVVGTLPDGGEVVIPGAFADWPPNDSQPVWDDITYLKYFQDNRFNYISYNTVRMYESTLLEGMTATESLWSELSGVIAALVAEYSIDGIMIDMAHALPVSLTRQIVERARNIDPDVGFWAEDFDRSRKQTDEGFNVVLGAQWDTQHDPTRFREMLGWISETPTFPPHLGAPETHNTRRASDRPGGRRYAAYAWGISNFIPAVPYLHSGLELGETLPTNTGLGFTPEELKRIQPDNLALFSAVQFDWECDPELLKHIRTVATLRGRFRRSCAPLPGTTFELLETDDSAILAFRRASPEGTDRFLVIGNSDMDRKHRFRVAAGGNRATFRDEFTGGEFSVDRGVLEGDLEPGQVLFFPENFAPA